MDRLAAEPGLTATRAARESEAMRTAGERWWDGPWPWLAYLVFLPLPWIWRTPDATTLLATGLALAAFLPLYVLAHRVDGWRLVVACGAITIIGLAVAPLPVGWTVFPIYAAAAIRRLRPPRAAFVTIAAIAATETLAGFALSKPTLWWLSGVLLVVLVGGATVSREAFYERTRALIATQEGVRRLAGTAERERITRDLHDVVGRTLTLVALKADLATRMLDRDVEAARGEVGAIADAARAGLAEVRAALAGQSGGSLAQEVSASLDALRTAGVEPVLTGQGAMSTGGSAVEIGRVRQSILRMRKAAEADRETYRQVFSLTLQLRS